MVVRGGFSGELTLKLRPVVVSDVGQVEGELLRQRSGQKSGIEGKHFQDHIGSHHQEAGKLQRN